jgi:hypothetical protein
VTPAELGVWSGAITVLQWPLESARCGEAPVLLVGQMAAGAFLYQSVITLVRCTTFC